jgi:DnaK suppressor protein
LTRVKVAAAPRLEDEAAGCFISNKEDAMNTHLTTGQKALIEAELMQQSRQYEQRLADHQQGESRAEHAHTELMVSLDDASQHASDREVDLVMLDQESRALADVRDALMRLGAGEYGVCSDCGADIAIDRLRALPTAVRCVECESRHERLARGLHHGEVHRAH